MALDEAAIGRVQAVLFRESGGRPLTEQQRRAARIVFTREAERSAGAGQRAAITEADLTLRSITRADGTVKSPKAVRKAAKAARKAKAAREGGEEALIRRKVTEALAARGIRETLTAAGVPQRPGAGMASSQDGDAGLYATLSDGQESPFWRIPAPQGDVAAEPPRPLHEMSADELRAFAAGELARHGQAHGFGSPSWEG